MIFCLVKTMRRNESTRLMKGIHYEYTNGNESYEHKN